MKPTIKIETSTRSTHTLKVTGKQIVELLIAAGFDVAPHARVKVYVPGGGDWSSSDLDIDNDTPVEIVWDRCT